ncbi:hypothetical protein PO124_16230 [Bacillus licheniformis]|nr:hypothetical protein [Bacillus licheniformis]
MTKFEMDGCRTCARVRPKQSDNKIINGFKPLKKRKCISDTDLGATEMTNTKKSSKGTTIYKAKNNRKEARKIAQNSPRTKLQYQVSKAARNEQGCIQHQYAGP